MKWEYEIIASDLTTRKEAGSAIETLDQYGEEGWEVVNAWQSVQSSHLYFLLKRPK